LFERFPHGLQTEGGTDRPFAQLGCQEVQRPGRAACWRLAPGDGHETRGLRAVEGARRRTRERWAVQGRCQPVLAHPLAPPMERGDTDLERLSALPGAPTRASDIGLQQHPRPQGLVPGHARPSHQWWQGLAFLVRETDDRLGFLAHGSLLAAGSHAERCIASCTEHVKTKWMHH